MHQFFFIFTVRQYLVPLAQTRKNETLNSADIFKPFAFGGGERGLDAGGVCQRPACRDCNRCRTTKFLKSCPVEK